MIGTLWLPRLISGMTNRLGPSRLLVGTLPTVGRDPPDLVGILPGVSRDPPDFGRDLPNHRDPGMVRILSLSGRDLPDQGALLWQPFLAGGGVLWARIGGVLGAFGSGILR